MCVCSGGVAGGVSCNKERRSPISNSTPGIHTWGSPTRRSTPRPARPLGVTAWLSNPKYRDTLALPNVCGHKLAGTARAWERSCGVSLQCGRVLARPWQGRELQPAGAWYEAQMLSNMAGPATCCGAMAQCGRRSRRNSRHRGVAPGGRDTEPRPQLLRHFPLRSHPRD